MAASRGFERDLGMLAQMALYADHERGRYPVWQTLDHPAFFPGCGILFVTVTVSQGLLRMEPKQCPLTETYSIGTGRLLTPD